MALKSDGTVWTWGHNGWGQLGNNTTTNSRVPVQVSNLSGITAISSGGVFSMALKNDGTV
jgi:alpha-tubulin suppressor-like RCC1 family protein